MVSLHALFLLHQHMLPNISEIFNSLGANTPMAAQKKGPFERYHISPQNLTHTLTFWKNFSTNKTLLAMALLDACDCFFVIFRRPHTLLTDTLLGRLMSMIRKVLNTFKIVTNHCSAHSTSKVQLKTFLNAQRFQNNAF